MYNFYEKEKLFLGKDEKIQKIINSWQGSQRLKEDTWQNVQLVLDYYGFTYERKKEWVCHHEKFSELAKNPLAKDLLNRVGLGTHGEFSLAVTHGSKKKSGMVLHYYPSDILRYIDFLKFLERKEENS